MRLAFISIALVGLNGLSGYASNPSTARDQLLLVSSQETLQMGRQAAPEVHDLSRL